MGAGGEAISSQVLGSCVGKRRRVFVRKSYPRFSRMEEKRLVFCAPKLTIPPLTRTRKPINKASSEEERTRVEKCQSITRKIPFWALGANGGDYWAPSI